MVQLIMYDIEKDKPRNKLAKYLQHHGLLRLQYSVFAGYVPKARMAHLNKFLKQFKSEKCAETDKIYILPITNKNFRKMVVLGPKPNLKYLLNEEHTYYI